MPRIAFVGAGSAVFTRNLVGDVLSLPELRDTTTFALMDIWLSLSTTTSGSGLPPALLSPSKHRPPVSAPSPTTATTWPVWPSCRRPESSPSAAEMAVHA